MKKLLFLIAPALLLLASCAPDYHNKIIGRRASTISCSLAPISEYKEIIDAGYESVDSSHAGNPLICDSVYTIAFTPYENWKSDNKWMLIIAVIGFLAGFAVFYAKSNSGSNNTANLGFIGAGLFWFALFIGGFYYFNPYRDIKKWDYDQYIQKDGDLRNFPLDPAKAY